MSEEYEHGHGNPARARTIRWCLFLVLLFLIIWLWIEPALIYYAHDWMLQYVIYVPGMGTFEDTPYFPGAVAKWAAGLLAHYYFYSAAGAAIITVVAGLLCFGAARFIAAVSGARRLWWLAFAPAFAIIVQCGRYSHFLQANLSLALGILLLCACTRLPSRRAALRFVVSTVFAAVMYFAAVRGFLAFVVLGVLFDVFVRRRWGVAVANLIVAAALPFVASVVLINLPATRAYLSAVPAPIGNDWTSGLVLLALALILPIAGMDWLVHRRLLRSGQSASPGNTSVDRPAGPSRWVDDKGYIATLLLLLVFAAVARLSINVGVYHSMRFNRFVRCRMWVEALDEARTIPEPYFTRAICHDVNRALYYTGRLGEEMFTFPQAPGELRGRRPAAYRRAELLYELGHVNAAEHLTHEALEGNQYNPVALQRLAVINVVKQMPDAARVFLQTLAKDFVHRDWALDYLARIDADPRLAGDQYIQHMRSLMPVEDTATGPAYAKPLEWVLMELSRRNTRNPMTFEYWMAMHLRSGQLDVFDRYLADLDSLDALPDRTPRHYEEAILLHAAMTGRMADLTARHISDESRARFERFELRLLELESADAADAMKEEFGDTYYYYYAFRLNRYKAIVARLTQ